MLYRGQDLFQNVQKLISKYIGLIFTDKFTSSQAQELNTPIQYWSQ